ncbi:MAG: glycosyl hydrolase [FCB group bacterium]|jgi:hypothetical protein|nr:glycosyl hydrolase [FCB group bacterium]
MLRAGMCFLLLMSTFAFAPAADEGETLVQGFASPPQDCRPRTRWWWPGNALTKEDITRQLRQMHEQGIGGVEQITMSEVYEKGNVPYLSDEYFDLVRHAVKEAVSLEMSLSLNFGGPGWVWGGDWIPPSERNQNLLSSGVMVDGPGTFDAELPTDATINPLDVPRSFPTIKPDDRLIAVVAGKTQDGVLLPETFQVLSGRVNGKHLTWEIPEGRWRIMAFWATLPDGTSTVNHIDRQAMSHYVDYLGEKFTKALGPALGNPIVSLFGDSFEVPMYRNGIYWCDAMLKEFQARKGYDLVTALPGLWWDVGPTTPKVRYDVNHVLAQMGMEAFYGTFVPWCRAHGVKSRVQPYGFVTDNLEGAGAVDIPEMEITAGEKDSVPWFDTRIWPREYVASGAHLYGRNIVSVEAYTYLHWQPYRATLEELKISSDTYFRAGANLFYNHGFLGTPEQGLTPSRGFFEAIHISPDNIWWPYYQHLSDYIARCCHVMRQGKPYADIAVYSPLGNQWSIYPFNVPRWGRDFDWGELGRILLANGYQFDLVNDDVLQNRSSFDGQTLRAGEMAYRALLVPNVQALPVETMRKIEAYAAQGGVVFALDRVPEASCGMRGYLNGDREVSDISAKMFEKSPWLHANPKAYGQGTTYWITKVMDRKDVLDQPSSPTDPFLKALRKHVTPDMAADLVQLGLRDNPGLVFAHRKLEARDIYFVSNIQDRAIDWPVDFRVTDAAPWRWNPFDGQVSMLHEYEQREGVTRLRLRLEPYESAFVVFEPGERRPHVTATTLASVAAVDATKVTGYADRNGEQVVVFDSGETRRARVEGLPTPLQLNERWHLVLEGPEFSRYEADLDRLISWTDLPETKHFSGTGVYTVDFEVPDAYAREDVELYLDLGNLGNNLADVQLNGQALGTVWMRGQRIALPGSLGGGMQQLEVRVTNTLINRVSGFEKFPPVPAELQPRLGQGLREAGGRADELLGYEPLPPSGLLGPVEIRACKRVEFAKDVM